MILAPAMAKILRQLVWVTCACAPAVFLVFDMAQRYSLGASLAGVSLVDAALLIGALGLPVFLLPRLGVDWRRDPDEF